MRNVLILLTLWLTLFTQSSQFLIVAPVLPRIGEQLHVAEELLGLLVTGYAVGTASFAILAGPVSDHVGRRFILRVGSAVMGTVLLLHSWAADFTSLLLLRCLAGASSGILAGAAVAYVGDVIPYERRGTAMGIVMSAMAFGQILGIPLGTVLAGSFGFQSAFVSFGFVMIGAFVLTMTALPAVDMGEDEPLGVGSALRSYGSLLARSDIRAVAAAAVLMMLSVSSFIVYQPIWLEEAFGASPNAVASLFLVGGLANAIFGPVAGRLSDRIGRKGLVVFGSVGLAVLMAITPFVPTFALIYPLFFVIMATVALRISPYNALLTAMVDLKHRGSLMSLSMAFSQAGFALGAAVAGWTYVSQGYLGNALAASACALAVGVIIALWVDEPVEEEAPAESAVQRAS
ncbi:MAG: MFS transporter [Myxococcales bacterium]|nr:MFS transporter [Myxococcales bacterium]